MMIDGYAKPKPREPEIEFVGPGVAYHDQRCAVRKGEFAVFDTDKGVFMPSWSAQADGWRLIQAKSKFQRFALKLLNMAP